MNIHVRSKHSAPLVEEFAGQVTEWEFIASGEGSESPFHQWRCAFHLGRIGDGTAYALQLHDFGDPNEEYEDDEPFVEVVAVATGVAGEDKNEVLRAVMDAYVQSGRKYIETYDEIGDFDVDEYSPDEEDVEEEEPER